MKKVTLPIAEESFPSNLLRPTPVSMSLLNCEIYQRGRVSRVADTELIATTERTPQSDHQVQFLV